MRNIDDRSRVICDDFQRFTIRQTGQPLARFQDRQRAQQPPRIKFGIKFHPAPIDGMLQFVHGNVRRPWGDGWGGAV